MAIGKADLALYRGGWWYLLQSGGLPTNPVPGGAPGYVEKQFEVPGSGTVPALSG